MKHRENRINDMAAAVSSREIASCSEYSARWRASASGPGIFVLCESSSRIWLFLLATGRAPTFSALQLIARIIIIAALSICRGEVIIGEALASA